MAHPHKASARQSPHYTASVYTARPHTAYSHAAPHEPPRHEASPPAAAVSALQALTAAALLLPGLGGLAQAQPVEGVAVHISRYRESPRALDGAPNSMPALAADSLSLKAEPRLPNGDGLRVTLTQDTWSGATPVSAAPRSGAGNRPVVADGGGGLVVVGASPMLTGSVLLDRSGRPVTRDAATGRITPDDTVVHTLSSASPETRRQGDLRWLHRIEGGAIGVGGGLSEERDFRSRWLNLERRFDLNDALSTVTLGLSRTRSDVNATLDHDAAPYITKSARPGRVEQRGGLQVLRGRRDDWALSAGLVQVLSRTAVLEARVAHTRQRGELSDPYRATSVIFAPPQPEAELRSGNLQALLEQRPDARRQWSADGKLILHVPRADAALHLGYGHYRDDWGIRAHRLEAEWFQPLAAGTMLSLRWRRYVQNAARFYTPYVVSPQAFREVSIGSDGQPVVRTFDPALLPAHFSSDHRLATFGATGWGLGWSTTLARDLKLDVGVEGARHSGALGGAWGFRYLTAQATLHVVFDETAAVQRRQREGRPGLGEARAGHDDAHAGHGDAAADHAAFVVPSGLQAAHAPHRAGAFMLGYRTASVRDDRAVRRGRAAPADDAELAARACAPAVCSTRPLRMGMTMHMLDLMLGLTERSSLMLMPQYMTMRMDSRLIEGQGPADAATHFGRHESGGPGDTQLHLLLALKDSPDERWLLGLGLSAPTGDTGLTHRRSHQQAPGAMDYAMQTGSGTWDLLPSLTWLRSAGPWGWGLQLGATRRLGSNDAGYALGDRWQAAGWVSRRLAPSISATLRASRSVDGPIGGERRDAHPQGSPPDHAANHGGRLDELGLGLVVDRLPGGHQGSTLGIEWLQPLRQDVRGYQLGRGRGLVLSWSHHF
jgi:hypothetical protein